MANIIVITRAPSAIVNGVADRVRVELLRQIGLDDFLSRRQCCRTEEFSKRKLVGKIALVTGGSAAPRRCSAPNTSWRLARGSGNLSP